MERVARKAAKTAVCLAPWKAEQWELGSAPWSVIWWVEMLEMWLGILWVEALEMRSAVRSVAPSGEGSEVRSAAPSDQGWEVRSEISSAQKLELWLVTPWTGGLEVRRAGWSEPVHAATETMFEHPLTAPEKRVRIEIRNDFEIPARDRLQP